MTFPCLFPIARYSISHPSPPIPRLSPLIATVVTSPKFSRFVGQFVNTLRVPRCSALTCVGFSLLAYTSSEFSLLIAMLEIAVTKFLNDFNATIPREFSAPGFVVPSVGVSYTLKTPVVSLPIIPSPRDYPTAMKFPFTQST